MEWEITQEGRFVYFEPKGKGPFEKNIAQVLKKLKEFEEEIGQQIESFQVQVQNVFLMGVWVMLKEKQPKTIEAVPQ